MNEWIMHLYSALLCIVVHPKCFTVMLSHSWLIQQIQYSEATYIWVYLKLLLSATRVKQKMRAALIVS